jgi:hypothetical protein
MNRREFCLGLAAFSGVLSASGARLPTLRMKAGTAGQPGQIRFNLQDALDHPFYWWPRTLLHYQIEFDRAVDPGRQMLVRVDSGEEIPFQISDIVRDASGSHRATLSFFSDLPSGARREFVLSAADSAAKIQPQVSVRHEGDTLILDSGVMRVRIPATQIPQGDAPGPIMQVSRGGLWLGSSTLSFAEDRVTGITTRRLVEGPLFVSYEVAYETAKGSRYVAKIQCEGGMEFVRFQENMEEIQTGTHGSFTSTWSGFEVTHRQAPNHPFPLSDIVCDYDDYAWERIDDAWKFAREPLPLGQLPFSLGVYERAPGNFRTGTWANFWDRKSNDALGVFIDNPLGWQDHEYAYEVESPTLQVRYRYLDGKFSWEWPLARGRRSTCLACYDHAQDRTAMRELELQFQTVKQGGAAYAVPLSFTSHTLFLQNRHGTLDLNRVKDWVLDYPESARRPAEILTNPNGKNQEPAELERRVLTSAYVCTLPVTGSRQMAGHGPIPGRSIVNFSPVPSRQMGGWIEGFNQCEAAMTARQRRRLTAIFLLLAYVHTEDEFMPVVTMLSGHPNFLADVKAVPPGMTFLFPDHAQAPLWADMWEKCVELNTRFNTRPAVKTSDALGGRWTENLGTYVWAFLRPSLRTDFLLKQYDGRERFLSPQLADVADWLVNALSAPFDGESPAGYQNLLAVDYGREWGVLAPGKGPSRVHPPQGAHSEQRIPPRSLWYLGQCLRRYAPLAAEHAMWAARPKNQDMEAGANSKEPWDLMYQGPENRGTNPHLRSRKFTGYGIVLRSAVDTRDELSIHLQQIDEGPNYRWGRAGEGGCGVLYFYAAGKAYSYTGPEDVGDRDDQDTDFCTTFGVYKNGEFRSIGMNVLSRPTYDLGPGQFTEIVPRTGPSSYATPEYLSRSVLLAGHDYFVLYDSVAHQAITHRLTWFVRKGDELPSIQLLRGAAGNRESQRTELTTPSVAGQWFDGIGDSLAVVSHRKDIKAEGTAFGCRVSLPGSEDIVFRNPQPVTFAEGDLIFQGTAGLIRKTGAKIEFALFHGTRIGIAGLVFTTDDQDLGLGGAIVAGQAPSGEFFAPQASAVRITLPNLFSKAVFFVDGAAQPAHREAETLVVQLEQGSHRWELSDTLPVPIAPRIVRTENFAGGGAVIIEPVASATRYRLELSKDGGSTWATVDEQPSPTLKAGGLTESEKVHLRVIALNAVHASPPGPEYPLYVSSQPPAPPDGLRVALATGAATVGWGEILGATEYLLYARSGNDAPFQLVYRGKERSFVHKKEGIQACDAIPGRRTRATDASMIEYYVTTLDGNGESVRSHPADTDPASWRNWDPKPGERFRRVNSFEAGSPPESSEWARYYPE